VYGREDMQVFRFQYFPSYATGQIRKLNVKTFQGKVFTLPPELPLIRIDLN
jgi:hypothetical protein